VDWSFCTKYFNQDFTINSLSRTAQRGDVERCGKVRAAQEGDGDEREGKQEVDCCDSFVAERLALLGSEQDGHRGSNEEEGHFSGGWRGARHRLSAFFT
jgi:hypothetical protein